MHMDWPHRTARLLAASALSLTLTACLINRQEIQTLNVHGEDSPVHSLSLHKELSDRLRLTANVRHFEVTSASTLPLGSSEASTSFSPALPPQRFVYQDILLIGREGQASSQPPRHFSASATHDSLVLGAMATPLGSRRFSFEAGPQLKLDRTIINVSEIETGPERESFSIRYKDASLGLLAAMGWEIFDPLQAKLSLEIYPELYNDVSSSVLGLVFHYRVNAHFGLHYGLHRYVQTDRREVSEVELYSSTRILGLDFYF